MLVSVYIRKADEDKWRRLPNKTEAISKLLNGEQLGGVVFSEDVGPSKLEKFQKLKESLDVRVDEPVVVPLDEVL